MMTSRNNRAFTLVELLVVLAISMILMGLVLYPVVKSFELTRSAEAMVNAQDSARFAMEQISRELGQAMFVMDNTPFAAAGSADEINNDVVIPVRQPSGPVARIHVGHAKIDFQLPVVKMHCNAPDKIHPADRPRDYERGDEAWPPCPVCGSDDVEARPKLPVEQGGKVVRYFLGLRYNNPNPAAGALEPPFGWASPSRKDLEAGAENQVVLYRVEFNPWDETLFPDRLETIEDRLADSEFFYREENGVKYWENWRKIVRPVGMGRYQDLVIGATDAAGNVTSLDPTVTFRFAAINNDTFASSQSGDRSAEAPSSAPTTYRAAHGYWLPGSASVTVYREDFSVAWSSSVSDVGDTIITKWKQENDGWTEDGNFNLTDYLLGNTGTNPEMAFIIDANAGMVNFALDPPKNANLGLVFSLSPSAINGAYLTEYEIDRGAAQRREDLITVSVTEPNCPRIVPGSERVIGPNMTPGPAYAALVRYERVPLSLGDAGLNQYKIDYDTGDIFFSPVYDQNLPVHKPEGGETEILVNYKISFNRAGDIVRGDYTTRSLVTVHLGMRIFDPESGKPSTVDLTNSIKVRNAIR